MALFYETELLRVEDLIPYALNSRTHSETQVAQIAASIREFGFTSPVLVDELNNVIAGHGRILAARKLGLDEIPAVIVTGLDDRRRRALVIADNKIALNAGWDTDALRIELEDLSMEFGELVGFTADELARLLTPPDVVLGQTDADEEWEGMPEFNQDDKTPLRTLHVHFRDEDDVAAFAGLIGQKITEKTRFVWYPDIEIETYADKRYVQDA